MNAKKRTLLGAGIGLLLSVPLGIGLVKTLDLQFDSWEEVALVGAS
jgi:hypothetical protein